MLDTKEAAKKKWAEYFESLLNVEEDREVGIVTVGGENGVQVLGGLNNAQIIKEEVKEVGKGDESKESCRIR